MDKFLKRSAQDAPSLFQTDINAGNNSNSSDNSDVDEVVEQNEVSESKKRKASIRQYDERYLGEYGFTTVNVSGVPKPQCVMCSVVLSNDAMKPAKLSRHFLSKHADYKGKPVEYFQRRRADLKQQKSCISAAVNVNINALRASYLVALRVAACGQPHTIAESLILPAAMDMAQTVLGEKEASKLKSIPLSNDTIQRRIADISMDLKLQVVERINSCGKYAIQLDESTDISNDAQLLTYVRYVFNGQFQENMLFCKTLPTNTTSAEIYSVINEFFGANNINCENCLGVCTDGAACMTGRNTGLWAKLRQLASKATFTHCIIHRENLAARK